MSPASPSTHAPTGLSRLGATERRIVEYRLGGRRVSRAVNQEFADTRTLGERLADRIAAFGGSWPFILMFGALVLAWVALNSLVLVRGHRSFDPYPYIQLNLFLSMLAALQAPIIMMSQNRQAARDRLQAEHDYEVNLTAEIEIRTLHDKLDQLRERDWAELVSLQQEQIRMLERLLARPDGHEPRPD
jgi:uncharacterized membrane protein